MSLVGAVVPREKVVNYLLSTTHPVGRAKAAFFLGRGFAAGRWEELAAALVRHAADHPATPAPATHDGIKYVVEGPMPAPDGTAPYVRSVWFLRIGETAPRFVTAYPARRRDER